MQQTCLINVSNDSIYSFIYTPKVFHLPLSCRTYINPGQSQHTFCRKIIHTRIQPTPMYINLPQQANVNTPP